MQLDSSHRQGSSSLLGLRPSQLPAALGGYADGRDYAKTNLLEIPSVNLPKGGGALRSIDEKFKVNAANGTSSLSLTIPLSKSRSDLAPMLSLNYNSGTALDAVGPIPVVGEVAGGYQVVRDAAVGGARIMKEELSIWGRGIRQLYGLP